MRAIHIDEAPLGVIIYDLEEVPLGVIEIHLTMRGNRAASPGRVLNNGKPQDKFAYRREILYRHAKKRSNGLVFVK